MANAVMMATMVAAPRAPKRSAAQATKGSARNATGAASEGPGQRVTTICTSARIMTTSAPASNSRGVVEGTGRARIHASASGAKVATPSQSRMIQSPHGSSSVETGTPPSTA
jgi:hypothetical protein